MKRLVRFAVLGTIAVAVIAGGLQVTGHLHIPGLPAPGHKAPQGAAAAHEAPPPAATVTRIAPAEFRATVLVTGTLVARDEIMVAPEIEGLRVLELLVDEGDSVTRAQVMARLVSTTLDAQLAQNDAARARNEAAIAQAKSTITQSEARLAEAQNAFERAKPLRQAGHIAESVYDQREAAAKMAAAQLASARDGLVVAEAELAQTAAQRRELDWRRSKTEVTAPADGLVSRRNARIGALASAVGDPMFRIIANAEIELDAEVPETQLARLKEGQSSQITVAGIAQPVAGRVRLVSPEIDRATRLGRVRVSLGVDPRLRIGAFGRGTILSATGTGLAAPASAVLFTAEGAFVQTVKGNRIETRRIKIGLQAEGVVEVQDGLKNGDIVITRAGTFLRDGDAVRPVFDATKVSEVR
jgi:RND family efflux transporter MFP subunit